MISHLDTVFPPEEEARNNFHWQPEGDRIFGPGTHDIKGGSVMMWLVLAALRDHAPKTFEDITWKLIWNSSEECFSPDFGDVCRAHFDRGTLAALVFESEGRVGKESRLVVARKGRGTWRVTVSGRAAHAGGKHEHGANAIVQLGQTVQQVAALTDYARDLTVNVGTICGGTVLNRVPHEAVAEGEFRTFTPEVFAQAKARPARAGRAGRGAQSRGRLRLRGQGRDSHRVPPVAAQPGHRRALPGLEAGRRTNLGLPVNCEERGGLSDGNLIWDAVPTLDGLGPWGDNDHCSERSPDGAKLPEFVDVSTFVPKAVLNTAAILRLCDDSK